MNLDHQESALRASQMHRIPDGYWPRDSACPPCTQNCNQGRTCPTPTACEVPIDHDEDDMSGFAVAIVVCLMLAVMVLGLVCAVAPFFYQS